MTRKFICTLPILIVLTLGNVACRVEHTTYDGQGDTQRQEAKFTERQQNKLIKATPPPNLTFSLERKNLTKRLVRFNDPNKVSYIYLINYGKVMAFYVIKGKVSSVNSKLTTGGQIIKGPYGFNDGNKNCVVESPQLDGSYGTNGDAIFFFTAEGIYVEWKGDYMLCDQPLTMATPPSLVMEIKR